MYSFALISLIELNHFKKRLFAVPAEYTVGQFPQKFFEDGSDGVYGEIVNIDKPTGL